MRSTAARGYGGAHQATRKRLIKNMIEGDPCPRCRMPMFSTPKLAEAAGLPPILFELHAGHFPGLAYGGPQITRLEHAHCNEKDGSRTGNRIRAIKRRRRRPDSYDRW